MSRAFLLVAMFWFCGCAGHALKNSPSSIQVNYPLEYRGPFLSSEDTNEIANFVQNIEGIDHHVQRISVESAGHVEVETGPRTAKPGGNIVHLRRDDGKWVVVDTSKRNE